MKDFIDTYWMYIKTFFKARAEYRMSFFLSLFSNFYCYFITFITYWILIQSFGTIGNWDFYDLSVLYGISLLTYSISGTLLWYTVYHLGETITSGNLDIYLIRPLGVMKQLIFQRFGDTFIGQIVVTLIFLISAFIAKINTINAGTIIYFLFAVIGGVFMQCGGMLLVGALSFWTDRSEEIGEIFYYDIRSLTQYPLLIYPKWIVLILTYIFPWAFINYYPSLILLNKFESIYDLILGLIAPCVGIVFFLFSLFIFKRGIRRYSGAGN